MEGPEITAAEAVLDNGRFGTRTVRFETGRLAQQAQGAVAAYLDEETMLLSATSAGKHPREGFDFFPLTVDVEERSYAAGKIPGSFFRREGRPSTEAILVCRLIDRPLRPSFVDGLRNEVQIVVTVLSIAPGEFYDALAINAASLSTQISGLPFSGPIAGVRLALIPGHGEQRRPVDRVPDRHPARRGRVRPHRRRSCHHRCRRQRRCRDHDGRGRGHRGFSWNLIKGGAVKPNEQVVAEGLEASKPFLKQLVAAQNVVANTAAKEIKEFPVFLPYSQETYDYVAHRAYDRARVDLPDRRQGRASERRRRAQGRGQGASCSPPSRPASSRPSRPLEFSAAYKSVTKKIVRGRILADGVRIDGRGLADIRPLDAEVQVIPRVHGSAIFQRGETQILGVTTLNMLKMEQQIDSLSPVTHKRYMHHYNFPPYSTGETGRVGSPKRREIGHGFLAERALVPVLPSREEFPYAIRQVSEALGSNGSTSMGSVCASTLSLLNAGVPLRAAVAGIAMGLVSDEVDGQTRYAALTDILGAEDALGDMDFKVAGTSEFVTAIQLDTKLDGIPSSVLTAALQQAHEARLTILGVLNAAIDGPDEMAPTAPRVISVQIPVDKIGELIGPKGKTINAIQDETGAQISIEEDGTVYIGATDGPVGRGRPRPGQRDRQPHQPGGRRAVPRHRREDRDIRRVHLAPARQGRPAARQRGPQARRRQARRERRRRRSASARSCSCKITKIDDRGKLSLEPVLEEPADQEGRAAASPGPEGPAEG